MMKEVVEEEKIRNTSSKPSSSRSSFTYEKEYEVRDIRDVMKSSRVSRFNLLEKELGLKIGWRQISRKALSPEFVIDPNTGWYRAWIGFILLWAMYSSFVTPVEFGFYRGLPDNLFILDIVGQLAFLVDIVLRFFVAYRDSQTYRMVYRRAPIAMRYLKSSFVIDLLACLPWDIIYKACGSREEVRYLLWIRLYRAQIVVRFFINLEKDIRLNFIFIRIVKLLIVELYCTHTAACIFYYLATTLPESQEGYTWIGSLKMGDYSYSKFREIDLWKRYTTSMYFAIVTMTTVGYGDIHAVNVREMMFVMVYVSLDMVLGAYLIGNITAMIVKGSKTEKFRDRMRDLMKYMNRNQLGKDIREQIKGHVRLQFESSYTDAAVLHDIPISIRSKISLSLYLPYIESIPLFRGCSSEFINQIVTRLHEEFFLPGEVILQQGNVVDQLYFVCDGVLEVLGTAEDGTEETVSLLEHNSSFGEISIICNIPQPYTVRVCELCRVLRLDKQSFSNILDIYFYDGKKVLDNLLEGKESIRGKQLESDITFHIGKLESELALKVNRAAFDGDIYQLKSLIRAGADPKKTDYDGRSPLHLAACRGYEDIILFLIHEGVDINIKDNFGSIPLLEAVKNGHDRIASLLVREGASMNIVDDSGSFLCTAVARGDPDYVKRLLSNGMDPNLKDYDCRTPLHVAASVGLVFMANLLLEAGASVFTKDRWGNTPLDEARMSGNKNLIKMLEDAKSAQLTEFPFSQEITDKVHPKKCTVYPFHPWGPKDPRRNGIVLWVPHTIEELIKTAAEHMGFSSDSCILSEDAGKITDVDMIKDDQKLYLVSEIL